MFCFPVIYQAHSSSLLINQSLFFMNTWLFKAMLPTSDDCKIEFQNQQEFSSSTFPHFYTISQICFLHCTAKCSKAQLLMHLDQPTVVQLKGNIHWCTKASKLGHGILVSPISFIINTTTSSRPTNQIMS